MTSIWRFTTREVYVSDTENSVRSDGDESKPTLDLAPAIALATFFVMGFLVSQLMSLAQWRESHQSNRVSVLDENQMQEESHVASEVGPEAASVSSADYSDGSVMIQLLEGSDESSVASASPVVSAVSTESRNHWMHLIMVRELPSKRGGNAKQYEVHGLVEQLHSSSKDGDVHELFWMRFFPVTRRYFKIHAGDPGAICFDAQDRPFWTEPSEYGEFINFTKLKSHPSHSGVTVWRMNKAGPRCTQPHRHKSTNSIEWWRVKTKR